MCHQDRLRIVNILACEQPPRCVRWCSECFASPDGQLRYDGGAVVEYTNVQSQAEQSHAGRSRLHSTPRHRSFPRGSAECAFRMRSFNECDSRSPGPEERRGYVDLLSFGYKGTGIPTVAPCRHGSELRGRGRSVSKPTEFYLPGRRLVWVNRFGSVVTRTESIPRQLAPFLDAVKTGLASWRKRSAVTPGRRPAQLQKPSETSRGFQGIRNRGLPQSVYRGGGSRARLRIRCDRAARLP